MAYIYDLTDTWNAGGTTFNGIKLNVTDSASAVSSKLVTLQTNGTEHFSVTKAGVGYFSGNVGIGTASPSTKFQVNQAGGNFFVGAAFAKVENTSGASATLFLSDTTDSASIKNIGSALAFSGSSTERMRIDASGNVGIGTSSPIAKLDVNGSINARSGTVQADLFQNWGSNLTLNAGGGLPILFQTNAAERMRIDASGNLLVGTTTASDTSTANGLVASGDLPGYIISRRSSGSGQSHLNFVNGGSSVGSIVSSTTATTYNTSSDYRLKDIDGPIVNSGAYIDALKPVQGSWKADGSRFIGLLAHEIQEVSETPIATGEKDGEEMQAMDYSAPELIANLIAELQSLRARVAQLEGN